MSDDAAAVAALLRRVLEARRQWVDVAPGVALQIQRPAEADLVGGLQAEAIAATVVGWRGVTLAHVLGAAAADAERAQPVPFAADLAAEVLRDNAGWLMLVAEALADAIQQHTAAREAAAGNSGTS